MLLRKWFTCTTSEGNVLLRVLFAFSTGEGSGNRLLRHTIIEDITCCEILFMRNEWEF